jgi:hypothetical protein
MKNIQVVFTLDFSTIHFGYTNIVLAVKLRMNTVKAVYAGVNSADMVYKRIFNSGSLASHEVSSDS